MNESPLGTRHRHHPACAAAPSAKHSKLAGVIVAVIVCVTACGGTPGVEPDTGSDSGVEQDTGGSGAEVEQDPELEDAARDAACARVETLREQSTQLAEQEDFFTPTEKVTNEEYAAIHDLKSAVDAEMRAQQEVCSS